PGPSGTVRFVISPRGGWGYSRRPLFVLSGEQRTKTLGGKYGAAAELHGQLHELAHFWWSIADANGTDDWINEGAAEYSAMVISGRRFGPEFRRFLIKRYQDDARTGSTQEAIVSTSSSSRDRY